MFSENCIGLHLGVKVWLKRHLLRIKKKEVERQGMRKLEFKLSYASYGADIFGFMLALRLTPQN